MNAKLANVLKTILIDSQNWKDISAGLVKDFEKVYSFPSKETGKNVTVRKRFPVSCEVTQDECEKGSYKILSPDSKKRAITYFEDLGTAPTGRDGGHTFSMVSNIRLVAWINMNMFGYSECSISNRLIISILNEVPENYFNYSGINGLKIEVGRIVPKNAAIFSRYSYEEPIMQYLLKPYDYFAIDFRCTYKISTDCFDPIVLGEDVCHPQSVSPSGGDPVIKGKTSFWVRFRTIPDEMEYDIDFDSNKYQIESVQFGALMLEPNQYTFAGSIFTVTDPNVDNEGGIYVNIELTRK